MHESATTEIYLHSGGEVGIYQTDGPIFKKARGVWEQYPDGSFTMIIKRSFEAGRKSNLYHDMGKFEFVVERVFRGELALVGDTVAVGGSIHIEDDLIDDRQVGFFNLIETTASKFGDEDGFTKGQRVAMM